jgi:hypothetical protein
MNEAQRFIDKFKEDPSTGCWVWQASLAHGYGQFWNGAHVMFAHRYSYETYIGPIPEGLVVDHLCRNRACVNPAHLRCVTRAENIMAPRSESRPAVNLSKLFCPQCGGDYTLHPRGQRYCIPCTRNYGKEFARKHRASHRAEINARRRELRRLRRGSVE